MNLEKHYEAASTALYNMSRGQQWPGMVGGVKANHVGTGSVARTAVNAFLSSLADDPRTVERMALAMKLKRMEINRSHHGADPTFEEYAEAALSAALREAGRPGGGREGPD